MFVAVHTGKGSSLFESLKQQDGDGAEIETFVASRGWFECFKKHSNLHNIHVTGESASADKNWPVLETNASQNIHFKGRKMCTWVQGSRRSPDSPAWG